MCPENLSPHEQISALVDGQLTSEAVTQAVQVLTQDEQARAKWYAYHLVGDVLRSGALPSGGLRDEDFLSRLRSRLKDEPPPSVTTAHRVQP